MKLASRTRRRLALALGVVVLATLVFQILRDGHNLEVKRINFQSTTK